MAKKSKPETKPWAPSSVRRAAERSEKPIPLITDPPKLTCTNEELEALIISWLRYDVRRIHDTKGRLLPLDMVDEWTAQTLGSIKVQEDYDCTGDTRVVAGHTKEFTFEKRIEAAKLLMKLRGLDGELKTKDKDRLQEIVDAMKHGPVKK